MKLKQRAILSYPTCKVFVKVSRRSVVDMAFKPTSKVAAPSRISWSPPRTKTLWSTRVVPYTGTSVGGLSCDDEYIGETSRTFGERYKEHLKDPSPIHHHGSLTGHPANQNNLQIIGREGHNLARNIKESIFIRVNNPTLNNNIGNFNLPHIWDRILLNMPGLNLKRHSKINGYVIIIIIQTLPLLIIPIAPKVLIMPTSLHTSWVVLSMYTEPPRTHISACFFSSLSDLMKSTEVDESLSTTTTTVLFQRRSACYKNNLIVQFLVFIQIYRQQPLVLYQLETVPVPILDQNDKAQSYTHLQIKKPYITLNSETYITLFPLYWMVEMKLS